MGLDVMKVSEDSKYVNVEVPPVRSDILHNCDVAEDIGIGFGFNNIPKVYPPTNTVGSFQPNNKFSDLCRAELAQAGYIEQLTFSLLSVKDNYERMRLPVDLDQAVQLSNPKTIEFEIVRTSLLPGLLKCLNQNKKESIPQKVFEVSDCVVLDPSTETGARNTRMLSAMVLDHASNFEVIHGMLDLMMTKIGAVMGKDYRLVANESDPRYFTRRGATIELKGKPVGSLGVIHPEVLGNFELKYPVSALEVDFDALFEHFRSS